MDYIIKVFSPLEKGSKDTTPKIKTIVCSSDTEMFTALQNAISSDFKYEVYKAQLELVLDNRVEVK